jgi:hypothetical protein
VVSDLINGEITWSVFTNISKTLNERLILYYPQDSVIEEDIVLSLLLKEEGHYFKPDLIESIRLGEKGWKNPNDYNSLSTFGTTDQFFVFSQDRMSTMNFDLTIEDSGDYSIFIKIHAPNGASLVSQLDDITYSLKVNETLAYRFIPIFRGHLEKGVHTILLERMDDTPLFFDLAYLINTNELRLRLNEFNQIIENNTIFVSDEYSEIVKYISNLKHPEDFTIFYSNEDLYSPNLRFRVSNNTYTPIKAWYAGSFAVVPDYQDSTNFGVFHVPISDNIRSVTTYYFIYIISLLIILVLINKTSWRLFLLSKMRRMYNKLFSRILLWLRY